MSTPFSRENSVRPDKDIMNMNYGEFRVYAMRKIQWEEDNCRKQIDRLNQEYYNLSKSLENAKNELNDTNDEKQIQNILFIMEHIKPGSNVKSEVEATRYVSERNDRIKSKKQNYQTECNRGTEIKNEIAKINAEMANWHRDYEFYSSRSSESDNKRIRVGFWDIFPNAVASIAMAYFTTCFFSCFLVACHLEKSCSGILGICELLLGGCGYLFIHDSSGSIFETILPFLLNMAFYLILAIIGSVMYSQNKSINIDERFFY